MKKGIISSVIASGLILIGSIFPAVAQANTTTTSNIDMNATGIVTTNRLAFLNGLHGNVFSAITDRGLAPNTPWYYNQTVIGADGLKYYRVATNEWVASSYLGKVTVKNTTTAKPAQTPNVNTSTGKIVGNSDSKIYHVPGQQNYKINPKKVVYFNTEQDAINAGYQKSKR